MRSPAAEPVLATVRDDGHRSFEDDANLACACACGSYDAPASSVHSVTNRSSASRAAISAARSTSDTVSYDNRVPGPTDASSDAKRTPRPALEPLLAAEQKALKEWAVVCRALEEGRQSVLLRKGGIIEETRDFALVERRFLLFPTYEHQDEGSRAGAVPDVVPRVDRATSAGRRRAHRLVGRGDRSVPHATTSTRCSRCRDHYAWSDDYIRMRMAYKPRKPMNVVVVRTWKLPEPVDVPVLEHFAGCKSWVPLDRDDRDGRRARALGRRARGARARHRGDPRTDEPSASRSDRLAVGAVERRRDDGTRPRRRSSGTAASLAGGPSRGMRRRLPDRCAKTCVT